MNIKRVLAWLLVIYVAYVVIYCYNNPEELQYKTNEYEENTSDYYIYLSGQRFNNDTGQFGLRDYSHLTNEPRVKETNPLVYYTLKYQFWLVLIGLLYWLIDLKGTQKLLAKAEKFIKSKDQ